MTAAVLAVACPVCGVAAGQPCRNSKRGHWLRAKEAGLSPTEHLEGTEPEPKLEQPDQRPGDLSAAMRRAAVAGDALELAMTATDYLELHGGGPMLVLRLRRWAWSIAACGGLPLNPRSTG